MSRWPAKYAGRPIIAPGLAVIAAIDVLQLSVAGVCGAPYSDAASATRRSSSSIMAPYLNEVAILEVNCRCPEVWLFASLLQTVHSCTAVEELSIKPIRSCKI